MSAGAATLKVLVIGATGGIGSHATQQAITAGHSVRALVRDASSDLPAGVERMVGDLSDAGSVEEAVAGVDAVLWTVGATRNTHDQVQVFERAATNVVAAMRSQGVRRLIALSGAGVTIDGETKPLAGRLMSAFVALVVRHVVQAKRREYEVFSRSGLDWTLVRPPRVVAQPAMGKFVAGEKLVGRSISQADLAEFIIRELDDPQFVHKAPYISQ